MERVGLGWIGFCWGAVDKVGLNWSRDGRVGIDWIGLRWVGVGKVR